jgi:hypothetical protein
MKDGLYRIETKTFCCGFVILRGRVEAAAPILRKNLLFWIKLGKWIAP